jgi:hypothetical protein
MARRDHGADHRHDHLPRTTGLLELRAMAKDEDLVAVAGHIPEARHYHVQPRRRDGPARGPAREV